MTIWDLCIRGPVFTVMLVSAPVVLGLVSYSRLGVELFPNVDVPVVTVTTTLRGASVEEMETTVTKPIEEIVNTVSGIDELRSTTKEGISQVVIQFLLEKNGDVAAQEVDAKVRTHPQPAAATAPTRRSSTSSTSTPSPVMTIAVSGRRDFREVTEIAKKQIKEDLETLPGVGAVILVGGRQRAINVTIDPDRLLKYKNLSIEDVRQALARENQELPGGRVDQGRGELVLRTMGRVQQPSRFPRPDRRQPRRLAGAHPRRRPRRRLVRGARGLSRLWSAQRPDGRRGLRGGQCRQPDRPEAVGHEHRGGRRRGHASGLKEIRTVLPPDIQIEVIRDQSRFIKNSIDEVQEPPASWRRCWSA